MVLEAQASGLPVIVTDQGGPCENIEPGETGLVVPGRDPLALAQAMLGLCQDRGRLRTMGGQARQYAEERSFGTAFLQTWRMFTDASAPVA